MDRSFKNALDCWLDEPDMDDYEGDECDLADIERQKRIDRETVERDALRYRKLRACERFAIDEKCVDGHWEPIGYEQLDEALDKEIENET
jgi:hypothetical protein